MWDVSQTTGEPIPESSRVVPLRGGAPKGLWDGLAALIEAEGFVVALRPRPAPVFVERLMGLGQGWVTNPMLGLTHAQQLIALGNGVSLDRPKRPPPPMEARARGHGRL